MPFTINVPGLNNDAVLGYGGPFGAVGGRVPDTGSMHHYQQFQAPFNTEEVFIPASPPVDGVVSILVPISGEGDNTTTVEVLGVAFNTLKYVPFTGEEEFLVEGTYLFDRVTQTLTIKLPEDAPPVNEQSIKIKIIRNRKRTISDRYRGQIPQFFRDWNINGPASFEAIARG